MTKKNLDYIINRYADAKAFMLECLQVKLAYLTRKLIKRRKVEADQLRGHVPGAKGGVEGPTSDRPPGGVAQPRQPEQLRDRGARQVDLVVPGLIN